MSEGRNAKVTPGNCISGNPYAGVTSGRCTREFLIPTANDSVEIELTLLQIPVASRDNLYAVVREVSIEFRYGSLQRTPCVLQSEGFGNDPQAELVALQSSFAVGDRCFEEILFRFIEETRVRTPRHAAYDVESGLPQLGGHRGNLSISNFG
jgi:hypothetical protein